MSDKVRYEVSGSVATVTITRPEVRNAMDMDVFGALADAGARAGADRSVRAVVVAGAGQNFSSGIDTSVFTAGGNGSPSSIDIGRLQSAFTIFESIPKPTIAAVAGPTFGAGLQLAIACDFRVAAADTELSVMEVRWGILPDLGGTQRLPRMIGLGRAKELAMTARRVGANEALQIGLVNKVVAVGEHIAHAAEWARELAAGPPLALAAIKRLMNGAFDTPVREGLDREATAQRRILASSDFIEAVTARVQKREPHFEAR
ncbi:MAG TPA: enoyl-CoA hydratase-related protein [Actinomycetota bacterium]|nr:enoyl-CoA hydratase-related protein [Actinomycetota bacterium]